MTYAFTPDKSGLATFEVVPSAGFDSALFIIEEWGSGCAPADCVASADASSAGGTEAITDFRVTAGNTYYLVVDGYGQGASNTGDYTLRMVCDETCSDADGDGLNSPTATCLSGRDCCDTGDEGGLGCSSSRAAGIHPDMAESCGDDIDQDCDGEDVACPECGADADTGCDDAGRVDTSAFENVIDDYMGASAYFNTDWSGPEYILDYAPTEDAFVTVSIDLPTYTYLDIFVMEDFGNPSVCNPDAVVAFGGTSFQIWGLPIPPAKFFAAAGRRYFISFDGREGAAGILDYTVACQPLGRCVPDATVSCGSGVSGDTTDEANNVNNYVVTPWDYPAPEFVYTLKMNQSADVTIDMTTQPGRDMALFVLEETGEGCYPRDVVAASDFINSAQVGWQEQLVFRAAAKSTYYVVVDGWRSEEFGAFDLAVGCAKACEPGLLDCGSGECIDVWSDPLNCGSCQPCDLPGADEHSCRAGACRVVSCDAGFSDCDDDDENGCEVDIGTDPENCGACGRTCRYTSASAVCDGGACEMGSCDAGFRDCDGDDQNGCETATLTDDRHCGACGNACAEGRACSDGQCLLVCAQALSNCGDVCVDLLSDDSHCGSCGNTCHQGAGCYAGACCQDGDRDGAHDAVCGGTDCDDSDERTHPGARESCDGKDQDCDGVVDEDYDADGDGYITCDKPKDCNDEDPKVNPGAGEVCADGIDNDCDGEVDDQDVCEEADGCGCTSSSPGPLAWLFLLLCAPGLTRQRTIHELMRRGVKS
jgi:hypothetical protein